MHVNAAATNQANVTVPSGCSATLYHGAKGVTFQSYTALYQQVPTHTHPNLINDEWGYQIEGSGVGGEGSWDDFVLFPLFTH